MSVIRPCGFCDPKLPSNGSERIPSIPEWVCRHHAELFWRGLLSEWRQTRELEGLYEHQDQRLYELWQENEQMRASVVDLPQSDPGTSAA